MEPIPDILHFRDELIDFLKSIGLSYPASNRFEESFKEIELALEKEAYKKRDFSREAHMRHALAELSELKFIVRSVPNMHIPKEMLKNKFKTILSGECPVDKKSKDPNDHSRNIVFELALAAYIHDKGLAVQYEAGSDICIKVDGSLIAIECKRINGNPRKSLKNLLRKAHKQLIKRKDVDFGVIAINIDSVFFSEGKMLVSVDGKAASEGFYSMINEFISKNGDLWQRRNIISSQEFVPAVFICLGGTAYAIGTNETANAFFVLINNTSVPISNNFEKIEAFSPKLQGDYRL